MRTILKKHAAFGKKIVQGVEVITHTEQQVSKNIEEDGPILKPYTHTFMLLHPRLDPLFSFVQNHKIFCQFLVVDGEFYYFYFFAKSLCGIL